MGKITLPTTSGEMFNLIIKEEIVQGILNHIAKVIKVTPPTIREHDMRSMLTYALSFNRETFMLQFNHFFGEEDKELAKFVMKLLYDVKVDSVSKVPPRIELKIHPARVLEYFLKYGSDEDFPYTLAYFGMKEHPLSQSKFDKKITMCAYILAVFLLLAMCSSDAIASNKDAHYSLVLDGAVLSFIHDRGAMNGLFNFFSDGNFVGRGLRVSESMALTMLFFSALSWISQSDEAIVPKTLSTEHYVAILERITESAFSPSVVKISTSLKGFMCNEYPTHLFNLDKDLVFDSVPGERKHVK